MVQTLLKLAGTSPHRLEASQRQVGGEGIRIRCIAMATKRTATTPSTIVAQTLRTDDRQPKRAIHLPTDIRFEGGEVNIAPDVDIETTTALTRHLKQMRTQVH
jgi:hypothetical protein